MLIVVEAEAEYPVFMVSIFAGALLTGAVVVEAASGGVTAIALEQ
jgi:hypothetical protein